MNKGKFEIRRFSDGEIHVKVEQDVKNKKVWVLASTLPPADNILELIFLLDVLKRKKAKIKGGVLAILWVFLPKIKRGIIIYVDCLLLVIWRVFIITRASIEKY